MTVVSHEHRLIFLKTRKTAGTSVELALSRFAGPHDVLTKNLPEEEAARRLYGRTSQNDCLPFARYRSKEVARLLIRRQRAKFAGHDSAAAVRKYVGERLWREYRKFTVERHPYERAVSMLYWQQRHSARTDILTFLRSFPPSKLSNSTIYAIDGAIAVDDIIEYDRLEEDFPALMEAYGVEVGPLGRAKISTRLDRSPAAERLGEEGRRLVQAACWEDFEHMGYDH